MSHGFQRLVLAGIAGCLLSACSNVAQFAREPTVKYEPITAAGNKSPYTVFGKTYTVMPSAEGFTQRGIASWYGKKFHGRKTSNGETYNMYAISAAHKSLPIPSYVRVTNLSNGKQLVVRVNDRGPFHGDRIIDLSYAAALRLGFAEAGITNVFVEALTPKQSSSPKVTLSDPKVERQPITQSVAPVVPQAEVAVEKVIEPTISRFIQTGVYSSRSVAESNARELAGVIDFSVLVRPGLKADQHSVQIGPIVSDQDFERINTVLLFQGYQDTMTVYDFAPKTAAPVP